MNNEIEYLQEKLHENQLLREALARIEKTGKVNNDEEKKAMAEVMERLGSNNLPSTKDKSNIKTLSRRATEAEFNRARQLQSVRMGDKVYIPCMQHGKEIKIAFPNFLLRSPLFAVGDNNEHHLSYTRIRTMGDASITIKGPGLIEYDRQVLAVLLQLASQHPLEDSSSPDENWRQISLHQLTKLLKVSNGVRVYGAILRSLGRIQRCELMLSVGKVKLNPMHLVQLQIPEEGDKQVVHFRVLTEVAELYGADRWTWIPESFFSYAKGFTGWLSAFYLTHSDEYPIDLPILLELTGAKCSLSEFRRKLKISLDKLSQPSVPEELRVKTWEINEKGKVIVKMCCWVDKKEEKSSSKTDSNLQHE